MILRLAHADAPEQKGRYLVRTLDADGKQLSEQVIEFVGDAVSLELQPGQTFVGHFEEPTASA